ncbi:dihydropteroate synthase [Pelosinus sp. UFO1]|uniref:dihydropteroate synthase n=1 Tax=Pelosinus sp. UFO1 TaxID=484770 RepID=UPI0004D1155D|nr:dihydropteroate synthase [Pelosinus sp. UFO1]AIF52142.1 dihydropteroate synthase [Pelosinus sp. UFO1]
MAFNARILTVSSLKQAQDELAKVNCDKTGIQIMGNKAVFKVMKLEGILTKSANLLKQTFLAKGGEVAVGRGTADLSVERTDVLICATLKQYKMAISQLKMQPWGLPKIAQAIEDALTDNEKAPERRYSWGEKVLSILPQRTLIMGILNVTPDSFSDGGRYNTMDNALRRVEEMIQNGADIIDIGAESTRPYQDGEKISAEEEMERLGSLLENVLAISSVPVSIDTYKPKVALQALQLGAHMINDVWGLQHDPDMSKVVAQYKVPVVIMHNQNGTNYEKDIMSEICSFLQKSIDIGLEAGISFNQFIVDPGIGFGKTPEQNLVVMSRLEELTSLRCPILLGTSNKRFIGEVLQLPVEDRAEGTGATVSMGIMKGSNIVRVHDVKVMARIAKMMDAMMRRDV